MNTNAQAHAPPAAFIVSALEGQSADARAKRTDLIGGLAIEERQKGVRDWAERVSQRLSAEGHEPVSKKVIGDASKIFDLFRLGGDQGFGWTRDRVAATSQRQLRVFAQNAAWSLAHREEVQTMLDSTMTEEHIRKVIQESKEAEARAAGEEIPEKEIWETVSLRLDPVQARWVRALLAGVRFKAEQVNGEKFSDQKAVADGEAALLVLSAWMYDSEEMLDDHGQPFVVENAGFVNEEVRAELEEAAGGDDGLETEESEDAAA